MDFPPFLFLDVETTGFRPETAEIIEIALAVWHNGTVTDRYSSLVNPLIPIPFEVTQLTGITDEMVQSAPTFPQIMRDVRLFIEERTIVGHNVGFDMSFLQYHNVARYNPTLDTLTLSSILYPQLGRYDLASLVMSLALPSDALYHRAAADVEHTMRLFDCLWQRVQELPFPILEEIVEHGLALSWKNLLIFQQAYQKRLTEKPIGSYQRSRPTEKLFSPPKIQGETLSAEEDPQKITPLQVELIADLLKQGSNFSRAFPAFEPRPQQVEMLSHVANAFNAQSHLIVEAGTGTGKSLAYLLPSAFWATQNNRRVVISTNTINLQDQLILKDIPTLQALLPFPLRVAVRKGKSNYLCSRLFQQLRHRHPRDEDEMVVLARLLLWLSQTETGDVNEITMRTVGERQAWRQLSGENAVCSQQQCSQERCPLHFARRRAEVAHLVVVNHALLLSDVANQGHILPPFDELIIDEAHHFEDAVTTGLSFETDQPSFKQALAMIADPKNSPVAHLLKQLDELPAMMRPTLEQEVEKSQRWAEIALGYLEQFFAGLGYFSADYLKGSAEYAQTVRLTPQLYQHPFFADLLLSWENLAKPLEQTIKALFTLAKLIEELSMTEHPLKEGEESRVALSALCKELDQLHQGVNNILHSSNDKEICWIGFWRERLSLHSAPLHVGELVQKHIFESKSSVILTSATLRTAPHGQQSKANFDYLQSRLNAQEVPTVAVGSPFDYKRSTLIYLCSDIPEPNQPGYQRYVEQAIVDVAKTLGGRTLVLFTSNRHLRDSSKGVFAQLKEAGIQLLAQIDGSSRHLLTAQFARPNARAVLFGTKSFWEGVDVPGPALECVIIVKLPFDVPTDPVIDARSETFTNPFMEYALPEAVLRFRQGFGRLIRRSTDEGMVIILDKRVLTKRYGEIFLQSLPECTLLRQRTERLPEIVMRWQKRERA